MKELLKELMNVTGSLWRLETHRETYGDTYVVFVNGKALSFEEAMKSALDAVESVMVIAGAAVHGIGCRLPPE